jgi:glycosyltransferase involved in cell wall biosynthesis
MLLRSVFFWIIFPCFLQMNTYRELAKLGDIEVNVVCQEDLSEYRKNSYGWESRPEIGNVNLEILPSEGWKERIKQILEDNSMSIHVFGSLLPNYPEKIAYARDLSFSMGLKTGIITEAPINAETKFVRRIFRDLHNWYLERKIRKIVCRTQFVLAIPNSKYAYFRKLGWGDDKIFPFGYFVPELKTGQNHLPEWAKRVEDTDKMKIRIIFAGPFVANKGLDLLIHALGQLHKIKSDFVCYLIGDGEQQNYIKTLIQKNNISNEVVFFGVRTNDQFRALLKNCDIAVVPQRRASWGVPALEAIQSGVAVIISDGDGASELVKISDAGRVFKSGQWLSLYSALYDLLCNNENLEKAKENATFFSKKIHPKTMAGYLNKALLYIEGENTTKPILPWINHVFKFENI